jgi:hypothetical protein
VSETSLLAVLSLHIIQVIANYLIDFNDMLASIAVAEQTAANPFPMMSMSS